MYPKLMVGDCHIHERHGKKRIEELRILLRKLRIIYMKKKCKSFLSVGDLLDRNAALSVPTIIMLGEFFRSVDSVELLVGNHDTPVKHAGGKTMLDLFKLVGAEVIDTPTVKRNNLYLPYYAPWDGDTTKRYDNVFMHKDIEELNPYFDPSWAMSLKEMPNAGYIWNGHLHKHQIADIPHRSVCKLHQLGAPYPTSWGDSYEHNRFVYVLYANGEFDQIPLNITVDAGVDPSIAAEYAITRTRDIHEKALEDTPNISMDEFRKDTITVEDCLKLIDTDKRVKKIAKGVINNAAASNVKAQEL